MMLATQYGLRMDITSFCAGPLPRPDEVFAVSEFVRATNEGQLTALAALFTVDAQVNDQLRNFWGLDEIVSWLEQEIVGERVGIVVRSVKKHYDVVILNAEITGDFEAPRNSQPMLFDLHFTVENGRIVRLLILLERDADAGPELRKIL